MVVQVIKWRPWSPLHSKKYEATITVQCLKGLSTPRIDADRCAEEGNCSPPVSGDSSSGFSGLTRLTVEVQWKGPKGNGFGAFRRSVKRNYTREVALNVDSGVVQWDEEFKCDCRLSGNKEGSFHRWEVAVSIFNASDEKMKKRVMVAGPAVLNLAEFVSLGDKQDLEINVPLTISVNGDVLTPSLCLSLYLSELRANPESLEAVRRSSSMPVPAPLSPCFGAPSTNEDDDDDYVSPDKDLKKVKSFTNCVSSRRSRKTHNGGEAASSDSKFSTGSEGSDYDYPIDTDSFDYSDEGTSEDNKDPDNLIRKAVEYGTLVDVNLAGRGFDLRKGCEDDLVYYSNRKLEVGNSYNNGNLAPDQSLKVSSPPKLGILWRKRKLNLKSRRVKDEPLLKKEYGESGGDDIDFDRRQLSSDDTSTGWSSKTEDESVPEAEFGDDNFAVGSWELKEIVTRDGSMRLQTQVFFASIDQRNVKAAGESACTALVVLIADWLHSNRAVMITKSEFDSLIREGSLQWRNLCQDETLMSKFPDKHFDLDTVLQAGVRPVREDAKKSFIGFFNVEEVMDHEDERLGFLHGAMSFDSIWDEIGCIASQSIREDGDSLVYIVSWNDHFFVLKVDSDAYYIIDTLGERLFEGCNQAFMLKFDKESKIERLPSEKKSRRENEKVSSSSSSSCSSSSPSSPSSLASPTKLFSRRSSKVKEPENHEVAAGSADEKNEEAEEARRIVCSGKEACKEYIKSFLAAIPIRELQADMKRGLIASTAPLHRRLQIEFHHTDQLPSTASTIADVQLPSAAEAVVAAVNGC